MKKPLAEIFGNVPVAVAASLIDNRYSPPRSYPVADGIAVIDVSGPLAKDPDIFAQIFDGVTGYGSIQGALSEAVADPDVKGILLRINSPGGEVSGMFETAKSIAEANAVKPVRSALDDCACSAAFLLASATSYIYIPPETGMAGSIGILCQHIDQSKLDEKLGLTVTTIFEGERKADFNPHEPLSKEAKQWLKEYVGRLMGLFVDAVAKNRGVSPEAIRRLESIQLNAEEALEAGLADKIAYFSEALTDFQRNVASAQRPRSKLAAAASASANPQKEGNSLPEPNVQADAANAPDIEALRKQVRSEALTEVAEVAAFCEVAGRPQLTASCIEQLVAGKTKTEVIAGIRKAKAEGTKAEVEIESAITTDAGATVEGNQRYAMGKQPKLGMSLADMQKKAQGVK